MKTLNSIPMIYHPTTTLSVDDNPIFLNSMRVTIGRHMPCITEEYPDKAFEYLCKHTYCDSDLSNLIVNANFDGVTDSVCKETFDVDFEKLRDEFNSLERFKKVTVAFIDQSMSRMDGLELCRKIRKERLLVKLILLTGNAGVNEAIKAFNEGIIDAYIPKDHDDLRSVIQSYMEKYSWQQFVDLSLHLFGMISFSLAPVYDEDFLELFHKIWKQEKAVEGYLVDSSCSFMLFDENGKSQLLFLCNDGDFDEAYEIAEDAKAPSTVLNAIQQRLSFPVKRKKEAYLNTKNEDWEGSMMPVNQVSNKGLYYVLIKQPTMKDSSMKDYLKKISEQQSKN